MATCGDELCIGLKYVLDQGVQQQQQQQQPQQNQQQQQQYDDPEMAMSPFSTEEASTAAASAVTAEMQETAPSTDNNSNTGYNNTTDNKNASSAVSSRNSKYTDQEIKATVLMISGCQDSQTSADVSNVSSFTLPDPNGRAGGACTSALLQGTLVVYTGGKATLVGLTLFLAIQSCMRITRSTLLR
jgi:hypothetical protein